jgi:hypothetical protein
MQLQEFGISRVVNICLYYNAPRTLGFYLGLIATTQCLPQEAREDVSSGGMSTMGSYILKGCLQLDLIMTIGSPIVN